MMSKNNVSKTLLLVFCVFVAAAGCAGAEAQPEQAVISAAEPDAQEPINTDAKNPLVAYYSRTGNAQMLAKSLAKHLDAEIEEIQSEEDRGILTIMGEQWFWADDEQKPFEKNLPDYSPIILVAPIYFMRLSAPGRLFIEEVIPEGSDVYVFTTSGGPLAGFSQEWIEELVVENGHNAKGVYGFQAGKTQEEFDKEVGDFLAEHQLISTAAQDTEQVVEGTSGDTDEKNK